MDVWRGENPGAGLDDDRELVVNDDMEVTGSLSVGNLVGTGVVNSANIEDGTITEADLANNSITSAKIANGTITGSDISSSADLSVDTGTFAGNIEVGGDVDGVDISNNTSISYNDSIGFSSWLSGSRNPVGSSTNISTGNIQAGRVFFSCRLNAGTYGSVSSTSERVVMPESFSEAFSVILTPTVPKTSFHIDFIYTAIPVSYNSFEIDTEQPSTGICMQSDFNWVAVGY